MDIDYAVKIGNKVRASASGEVIRASEHWVFGKLIIIDHAPLATDNGRHIYTFYGHLSKIDVELGEFVLKGEEIGLSGGEVDDTKSSDEQTSTGPHLHFGVFDSKGPLKFKPTGKTSIPGYNSSNPENYIGHEFQLDGTILDINDLQEQTTERIRMVMELVPNKRKKWRDRYWCMDVMVYGKYMGYLDKRNLELRLDFTLQEAIEILRKPITKRTTEYVVAV